jgi:ribonuclease P protein component, eubacterial
VLKRGRTVRGQLLTLRYVRNNRQEVWRAAVVVGRKVNKSAVVRNRIRRRIYEIIRKNADLISEPYDLLISVYGDEVARMPHATLQRIVLDLLGRANVIRDVPETEGNVLL